MPLAPHHQERGPLAPDVQALLSEFQQALRDLRAIQSRMRALGLPKPAPDADHSHLWADAPSTRHTSEPGSFLDPAAAAAAATADSSQQQHSQQEHGVTAQVAAELSRQYRELRRRLMFEAPLLRSRLEAGTHGSPQPSSTRKSMAPGPSARCCNGETEALALETVGQLAKARDYRRVQARTTRAARTAAGAAGARAAPPARPGATAPDIVDNTSPGGAGLSVSGRGTLLDTPPRSSVAPQASSLAATRHEGQRDAAAGLSALPLDEGLLPVAVSYGSGSSDSGSGAAAVPLALNLNAQAALGGLGEQLAPSGLGVELAAGGPLEAGGAVGARIRAALQYRQQKAADQQHQDEARQDKAAAPADGVCGNGLHDLTTSGAAEVLRGSVSDVYSNRRPRGVDLD